MMHVTVKRGVGDISISPFLASVQSPIGDAEYDFYATQVWI